LTDTIAVALVSAGGSVAVAITALLLNFRLFNSLERRIEVIESDLKTFFKMHGEFEKRISKLEDKK
jgi:biopolymer transport protein ExbB/TolQ